MISRIRRHRGGRAPPPGQARPPRRVDGRRHRLPARLTGLPGQGALHARRRTGGAKVPAEHQDGGVGNHTKGAGGPVNGHWTGAKSERKLIEWGMIFFSFADRPIPRALLRQPRAPRGLGSQRPPPPPGRKEGAGAHLLWRVHPGGARPPRRRLGQVRGADRERGGLRRRLRLAGRGGPAGAARRTPLRLRSGRLSHAALSHPGLVRLHLRRRLMRHRLRGGGRLLAIRVAGGGAREAGLGGARAGLQVNLLHRGGRARAGKGVHLQS